MIGAGPPRVTPTKAERVPFVGPHDRGGLDLIAAWRRRRSRGNVYGELLATLEGGPTTITPERRGASYATLDLIAAEAGLDEGEAEEWRLLAESVPLSEGQALRILAALSGRAA